MQTAISDIKSRHQAWVCAILIAFTILPAFLVVKNIKISPDSIKYTLISQEILAGNGIRLPVIRLEDHQIPVNGTIPYPEEGPLLPMLFALMGGITYQNYLPAQIINFISLVVISVGTFLLMIKLYDNLGVAFLTAILVSVSFPILRVAHFIWTEILFIALSVLSIYFIVLFRHTISNRSIGYPVIASISASAAILTRFPGVALIPLFLWEAVILARNKRDKVKYIYVALAAIPPVITMGILFIRNYIHSGSIFGWNPPPFERSHLTAFTGVINMMFEQFSLGSRSVTLISICIFLFIIYILVNSKARSGFTQYIHSGLDLIMIYTVIYTVLITLALAKSQFVFELRFVTPLVPFLFILCLISIMFVWERVELGGFPRMSFIGVIVSLSLITAGNCYKSYLRLGGFSYKQERFYSILHSPTYKWLRENYGEDVIITSNKPYSISFFGGFSTMKLPNRRFDKSHRIDETGLILPNRMSEIGSRVLALFDKVEEEYEGKYLAELFSKTEGNDDFIFIRKFSDGVVYHLRE